METTEFRFSTRSLDLGTPVTKFQNNMAAIQTAKACLAEQRPATPAEQEILSRYVGWGDTNVTRQFYNRLNEHYREMLTPDEEKSLKASTVNAHYTELGVIWGIWRGLMHLGIDHLHSVEILDPSAGIGHFKSMCPMTDRVNWVEIELDKLTSQILQLLHPESKVYAQGYEKTQLPPAWFDLAISNVPFGNYPVITDRLPGFARSSIHDFFFCNTIDYLKPGGMMVFITSRYTMDKKEPAVRKFLARHMDLIGAVRLPYTAFVKNAGTEVVTDVLFLRKREQETNETPFWVGTKTIHVPHKYQYATGYEFVINAYFADHPECVLGKPGATSSMYGSDGYNVEPVDPTADLGELIAAKLSDILPKNLLVLEKIEAPIQSQEPVIITSAGKESKLSAENQTILDELHEIYHTAKNLLAGEQNGKTLFEVGALRQKLNQLYDTFYLKRGAINKKQTVKLLEGSVEGPFLKALENYDPKTGAVQKSGIFKAAMVRSTRKKEDLSVNDALLMSLDAKGRVDPDWIADQVNRPVGAVLDDLGDLVFRDPVSKHWLPADEYLSGNVREKLRKARDAAAFDPSYQRNVDALGKVIPVDLKPGEIRAPLGAGWIAPEIVAQFACETLKVETFQCTYIPKLAQWELKSWEEYRIPTGLNYSRWGTSRMSAVELLNTGLNQQMPIVYDPVDLPGGGQGRVTNQTETVAAQAKLGELKEEWEKWLWKDAERGKLLAEIYNEKYNAFVIRKYNGAHLSLPGLSLFLQARANQKNLVWRIMQSQTCLAAHEVGAGKTLAAIISIMESKRLGLIKKGMVVVPNHLTGQWAMQSLSAYPAANILVATSKDLNKGNRSVFMSRIATNDWDIIIVPFSSFGLLPVKPETMEAFYQGEIDRLEEYLYELKAEGGSNPAGAIKDIEKAKKRFEAKLAEIGEMKKDAAGTITWEEMGVDMLVVDEFHCLPYEARVETDQGLLPIGEIVEKRLPVHVKSVDTRTGEVQWNPVTEWFDNAQSAPMVRIEHEQGVLECTANHKVWTFEEGYVEAGKLTSRHSLKSLSGMQKRIHSQQQGSKRESASSLFKGLPEERATQDDFQNLRAMRERVFVSVGGTGQKREAPLLFKPMCSQLANGAAGAQGGYPQDAGSIMGQTARKQKSNFVCPYASPQSQPVSAVESHDEAKDVRAHFFGQRWEWVTNASAKGSSQSIGSANGIFDPNQTSEGSVQISAKLLQGGYCRSEQDACYRDRWSDTPHKEMEISRSSQDGSTERSRVVRVTFLQSRSGYESGVRAGTNPRVYCLEVAQTHNFFAEGILVSNCFKNLYFATKMTRIAGLPNSDTKRAFDMYVKILNILERGGKVVGMTGTPVTNTIAEMFTMQRYFQMQTLEDLGLSHFDAWASQFAIAEPGLEMAPDGSGFRMNTRFRKFVNVPELMKIICQVVDFWRIDQSSGIERPNLWNQKPVKVVSDGGAALKEYTQKLAERAERIHSGMVEPKDDNMLKVSGDGRKAALDMSLVVPQKDDDFDMPKIDKLVDLLAEIYRTTNDVLGAQLVFCDLATPKAKGK